MKQKPTLKLTDKNGKERKFKLVELKNCNCCFPNKIQLNYKVYFLEEITKPKEGTFEEHNEHCNFITPFYDGVFHGIDCMQNDNKFGFFKSENDKRPSSAIYLDKEVAEVLYSLFSNIKIEQDQPEEIPIGNFGKVGFVEKQEFPIVFDDKAINLIKGRIENQLRIHWNWVKDYENYLEVSRFINGCINQAIDKSKEMRK